MFPSRPIEHCNEKTRGWPYVVGGQGVAQRFDVVVKQNGNAIDITRERRAKFPIGGFIQVDGLASGRMEEPANAPTDGRLTDDQDATHRLRLGGRWGFLLLPRRFVALRLHACGVLGQGERGEQAEEHQGASHPGHRPDRVGEAL